MEYLGNHVVLALQSLQIRRQIKRQRKVLRLRALLDTLQGVERHNSLAVHEEQLLRSSQSADTQHSPLFCMILVKS